MAKDNVNSESFDSDEFSEVHTICSDSDILQPPRIPRMPKTPKTPKMSNRRKDDLKSFWYEGDEFVEVKNLAKPVGKGKCKKISVIWKLSREVKCVKDERSH